MSARAWVIVLVAATTSIGAAHALDSAGVTRWDVGAEALFGIDGRGALRALGSLTTWLAIGLVFLLIDSGRASYRAPLRDAWTRSVLTVLASTSAGAIAELLKLIVRRARPYGETDYVFRPVDELTWSTGGLGMPSSHAAVAFGACVLLAFLHPRAAPVFVALAAGCAVTRVLDGAHFVSDVVAGAWVGVLCACAWWAWHRVHLKRDGAIA